jgi:serine/threonine protein kinase
MIGRKIDRYEILAKLGESSMGSVWRTRHPVLERDVALKILPPSLAQSEEARQRLLREAETASSAGPGLEPDA